MRAISNLIVTACWTTAVVAIPVSGETVTVPAVRDGFVRQQAPTLNFGTAGNLCVAGDDSVNANAEPRGRFDTVIEFDPTDMIATLNTSYGPGGWIITAIELRVSEISAPQNQLFPRGVGLARCAWLPNATFTEGAGTPNAPIVGAGDELTWNHLQTLLAGSTEQLLGDFANFGANGSRVCPLSIDGPFAMTLQSGEIVTLHLSPISPNLGFTFHSRDFFDPELRPRLNVTVDPIVPGDVNCDNQLDSQDVPVFVPALVNPSAFEGCDIARADMDSNGMIDGRDVAYFVEATVAP